MRDTDYAFSVGTIRCSETKLIGQADLDRMAAAGKSEGKRILASLGFGAEADDPKALAARMEDEAVAYLRGILPDERILYPLLIKNDFANLKSAIKAAYIGRIDIVSLMKRNCVFDWDALLPELAEQEDNGLPELLADTYSDVKSLLASTRNARLSDCLADARCLDAMQSLAADTGDDNVIGLIRDTVGVTCVRIVSRARSSGADPSLLAYALPESCGGFDRDALISAFEDAPASLLALLREADMYDAAEALDKDPETFETYCAGIGVLWCADRKDAPFGSAAALGYLLDVTDRADKIRVIFS